MANRQRKMGKKWNGQDESSHTGKGCSREGDELVKKSANQPKSKINLQKGGGVPVKQGKRNNLETAGRDADSIFS